MQWCSMHTLFWSHRVNRQTNHKDNRYIKRNKAIFRVRKDFTIIWKLTLIITIQGRCPRLRKFKRDIILLTLTGQKPIEKRTIRLYINYRQVKPKCSHRIKMQAVLTIKIMTAFIRCRIPWGLMRIRSILRIK